MRASLSLFLALLAGCTCRPPEQGFSSTGAQPDTAAPVIDTAPLPPDTSAPPGPWLAVSAGFAFTCGIRPEGSIECWGSDQYLGPHEVRPGPYVQVDGGGIHACGLLADGRIDCWGCGAEFEDTMTAKACMEPEGRFVEIDIDSHGGCAHRDDGAWVCWGALDNGVLHPTTLLGYAIVRMGDNMYCGLPELGGEPECWGSGMPERWPPDGLALVDLEMGYRHTCGLEADGSIICWGLDENEIDPVPAPPPDAFVQVDAWEDIMWCGRREDGTVECMGSNNFMGHSDPNPPDGARFIDISVGATHACGLTEEHEIVCWGQDRAGELDVPE